MKKDVIQCLSSEIYGLPADKVALLYASFMKTFRTCAERLKELSDGKDFLAIRDVTHSITGFSQNAGAMDLAVINTRLNNAAKEENSEACATAIEEILKLFQAYDEESK